MPRNARWTLPALAIVLAVACNRPNLESTGGGYGTAATTPATAAASEEAQTAEEPATLPPTVAPDSAPGR